MNLRPTLDWLIFKAYSKAIDFNSIEDSENLAFRHVHHRKTLVVKLLFAWKLIQMRSLKLLGTSCSYGALFDLLDVQLLSLKSTWHLQGVPKSDRVLN